MSYMNWNNNREGKIFSLFPLDVESNRIRITTNNPMLCAGALQIYYNF